MKRKQIIDALKEYFDIRELVCNHTYNKFGEKSWQFLDTEILHTILVLRRDLLKKPLFCNNWSSGGQYSQRGLRCNMCQIVKDKTNANQVYLSSHCNGAGFDFTVIGMSAEVARAMIEKDSYLLPFPVRIESNVSWLHVDCYDSMNCLKVTQFT